MANEPDGADPSSGTIAARRASLFWLLVPMRFRLRLMTWGMQRQMRRRVRDQSRAWRAEFSLLTVANSHRVVRILQQRWDTTGIRLLGVPQSTYTIYAERLLMLLSHRISDAAVAAELAAFEADLGLRDSPEAHRLQMAAEIRDAIVPQVT